MREQRSTCVENSATIILEEIDSILVRLLLAFGESSKPIPPIVALIEFLVAEELTSWEQDFEQYRGSSLG